jgi:transcription antitermination factor NusG
LNRCPGGEASSRAGLRIFETNVPNENNWFGIDIGRPVPEPRSVLECRWFVAHVRPRREKKLVEYCRRQSLAVTLPCYSSAHKYRGKTVVFQKPLFPGYVFLQLEPGQKESVRQNEHVANLLEVFDQETFEHQLQDILAALEANLGVRLAPTIGTGMRVRIKAGPLQGIEGWVEQRYGMTTVLLRLDFINQAAAVKLEADLLELI